MPKFEQMTFEEHALNQLRSWFSTLRRYHRTSMVAHNRPVQSVYSLASTLGDAVESVGQAFPESEKIQRWVMKFQTFVVEQNLDEPRTGD